MRWFLRRGDKGKPTGVVVGMNPSFAYRLPALEEARDRVGPGTDKTVNVLIQQLLDVRWPARRRLERTQDQGGLCLTGLDGLQIVMLNVVPWRASKPKRVPDVIDDLAKSCRMSKRQVAEAGARVTRTLLETALQEADFVLPMWGVGLPTWLKEGLRLIGDDLTRLIKDYEVPVLYYPNPAGLPYHCGYQGHHGKWGNPDGFTIDKDANAVDAGAIGECLRRARRFRRTSRYPA